MQKCHHLLQTSHALYSQPASCDLGQPLTILHLQCSLSQVAQEQTHRACGLRSLALRLTQAVMSIAASLLITAKWALSQAIIHSPAEGPVGCLQFGAIMNKAAANIFVQALEDHKISLYLSKYPGVG